MSPADLLEVVPENAVRFLGHETHAHPVPHLIHVVSGSAELVVDGAPMRLGARENLWLARDVPHSARYASGSVVLGPFLSPETSPPGRAVALGVVPSLTRLTSMILGASPRTEKQIHAFRAALDEALLAMNPDYFALPLPNHPVARSVARAAIATDLTLEQLAAERQVSVRHLQRLFLEETGLSFSRWRTRAKLNIAVRRLRGGDGALLAARIAGYASRAGLLKALGREAGVSQQALAEDPLTALDGRTRGDGLR